MKNIKKIVFLLLFLSSRLLTAQTNTYSYLNKYFSESISLHKNGTFNYQWLLHGLRHNVEGSWRLSGDSLILASYPQKEKLLVFENYVKKNKYFFYVTDKKKIPIVYDLYLITHANDTIVAKEQFIKTVSRHSIKAFYIVNTIGIKSPTYVIQGSNSNYFEILFETQRVFENEIWFFKNNYLIPIGLSGEIQNYLLKQVKSP